MNKFVLAALLSVFITAPAAAIGNSTNVGINFSSNSALGFEGEFDVSSMADNKPVTAQVFLKNYSYNDSYVVSWNATGVGVAGIYDFNTKYQLDKTIHPYAGIGLVYVTHKWTGKGPELKYTGAGSGLYITGGVRYSLTSQVAADLSYNNFGDLTVGINLKL
jgi:opacity protein-like surface antigen